MKNSTLSRLAQILRAVGKGEDAGMLEKLAGSYLEDPEEAKEKARMEQELLEKYLAEHGVEKVDPIGDPYVPMEEQPEEVLKRQKHMTIKKKRDEDAQEDVIPPPTPPVQPTPPVPDDVPGVEKPKKKRKRRSKEEIEEEKDKKQYEAALKSLREQNIIPGISEWEKMREEKWLDEEAEKRKRRLRGIDRRPWDRYFGQSGDILDPAWDDYSDGSGKKPSLTKMLDFVKTWRHSEDPPYMRMDTLAKLIEEGQTPEDVKREFVWHPEWKEASEDDLRNFAKDFPQFAPKDYYPNQRVQLLQTLISEGYSPEQIADMTVGDWKDDPGFMSSRRHRMWDELDKDLVSEPPKETPPPLPSEEDEEILDVDPEDIVEIEEEPEDILTLDPEDIIEIPDAKTLMQEHYIFPKLFENLMNAIPRSAEHLIKNPQDMEKMFQQEGFEEFVRDKIGLSPKRLQDFFNTLHEKGLTMSKNPETGKFEIDTDISTAQKQEIFKKLAEIADRLDKVGSTDEADLIDEFMAKHAVEQEQPAEEKGQLLDVVKQVENEIVGAGDEDSLKNIIMQLIGALKEFVEDLGSPPGAGAVPVGAMASSKPILSKRAYVPLDWKGEDAKSDQSKRYDSKYHRSIQIRDKDKKPPEDREGRQEHHSTTYRPVDSSLSTRYCPDHVGAMMGRVGESTYQCPIDNEVYNWEVGYTTYDGKDVPGSSVAGQTPGATGYFETPARIFDSREQTLNRIN